MPPVREDACGADWYQPPTTRESEMATASGLSSSSIVVSIRFAVRSVPPATDT